LNIYFEQDDLPDSFMTNVGSIAIDTETMGLCPRRDRLCLAQFSMGNGDCYLVKFNDYGKAKNIKKLLADNKILKIFHYARFDMAMLYYYLSVMPRNVYCTKIASKLVRTYTQKHSLADLCRELLGIEISKEQTCTDWGNPDLSPKQLDYAGTDVLYLHEIKNELDVMLVREKRMHIAEACFNFLETRVTLDLLVHENYDIFAHGG
jgi:ribonuclease D